jgi:tRNA(Ile)-lysidine synthetase-like protein
MEEVYNFIRNKINLKPGDTIVAGVSGGPDSMALIYILNEFKEKMDLRLVCAHINHNTRKETEEEEKYLRNYCKENNIIFECIKVDKWGDDNFENEARTVRYNFFEELVDNYGAKYLMTAHHADDLIETILMRIVRGSTLKGYSGFSKIVQKNGYKIIRPLITLTKDEIIEFDKKNNIKYFIDSTNNDDVHTRNRYRHVVLPFLKKENPNVHKKFIKFSETLLENSNYIDE